MSKRRAIRLIVPSVRALAAALAMLAWAVTSLAAPVTLYVSPRGDDTCTGLRPTPDGAGKDGPLATLAGARNAVRALRQDDGMLPGPVTVQLRAGTYQLTAPVLFGPEDSGTEDSPITYTAYPGERPIISGAQDITGWRPDGNTGRWVADTPQALQDPLKFRQLFAGGERRRLARSPNTGTFRMAGKAVPPIDPATGKPIDVSKSAFRFVPGDIQNWPDILNANVVVHYAWETGIYPIKRVDTETNTVHVGNATKWPFTQQEGKQPYYVEGTVSALDEPGEWCLSPDCSQVFYIPLPGEDPNTAGMAAPVCDQLIVLAGEPDAGMVVANIRFEGLRFMFGGCTLEPEGHCDWQAAHDVPGMIQANGAVNCAVENCELAHFGLYGVWFKRGCKGNRIAGNHIHDMGAGGVRLGEGGRAPTLETQTGGNIVTSNLIHGSGKVYGGAVGGVWVGHASDNQITHNDISDTTWMGISVGWSWGYAETQAHRNDISYNHLHGIGKWLQPDMGAIYTLGVSPGTRIHHNHIHDVTAGGIYPDEGSSDIVIDNNLVHDVLHGCLTVHYGQRLLVRNNIFAFGHSSQIHLGRRDKESSIKLERNIIYFDHGDLFRRDCDIESDHNLFWQTNEERLVFPGDLTLEEWRARGLDVNSVVADPLFMAPEARDFRLRPESPALALGFQPINLSTVGLVGPPELVAAAKAVRSPRVDFSQVPQEEPQLVDDGFETSPVGVTADGPNTHGETDVARIRVSDEQAASGKHSLKFQDAAGLDETWNPHIYYMPHLTSGLVRMSFDVRMQDGAILAHEWRDGSSPFRTGPSIVIDGDGTLLARGERIATIPADTWVHIEITEGLGKKADGLWDLRVVIPGQPEVDLKDLPGNAAMRTLQWVGFVSNAVEPVAFYVDNVKLEVLEK